MDVVYAGMMQYDGDLKLPRLFLVSPPKIEASSGEYLARNKVTQLAISETRKYGHVTEPRRKSTSPSSTTTAR